MHWGVGTNWLEFSTLGILLKIGMGFYCCSHNIERLLRYAGMVSCPIQNVFPRKKDGEKKLFNHLQKAYIDRRYREDYSIGFTDLLKLTERVRTIQDILAESGKTIIKKKDDE